MNTANPFNYVELKKEPGRKSRVYYCTGIYKYVTMHVQCKLILCTATCICKLNPFSFVQLKIIISWQITNRSNFNQFKYNVLNIFLNTTLFRKDNCKYDGAKIPSVYIDTNST